MLPKNPPLNAFRAFESTARTGSFTSAAQELHVSSAAVSQQVKVLEIYWGKKLFIRQGNRLSLTEAGLAAYPPLAQAMNVLLNLSDNMRDEKPRARLVLSVPHSVAETWLALRLSSLLDINDSQMPEIRIEEDPIDFARDGVDMRIFYGHDLYTEYRIQNIFYDSLVAVASPDFVDNQGETQADISDRFLIHTNWGRDYASSPNWSDHVPNDRQIDWLAGIRVAASSTAIAFARCGLGAAIVPLMMAKESVESGQLVRLKVPERLMVHPYAVASPHALADRPDMVALHNAIMTG